MQVLDYQLQDVCAGSCLVPWLFPISDQSLAELLGCELPLFGWLCSIAISNPPAHCFYFCSCKLAIVLVGDVCYPQSEPWGTIISY